MLMDSTKDVQGVALYTEWKKPGATTQIFFTPDGYATDGTMLKARMYRRVLTTENPRKQWRFSVLYGSHEEYEFEGDIEKRRYTTNRISSMREYFIRLIHGDWKMIGEPLLIEVSKKDLDDLQKDKTPTKFLYRVDLTKKAKGFEDPLKNDEE